VDIYQRRRWTKAKTLVLHGHVERWGAGWRCLSQTYGGSYYYYVRVEFRHGRMVSHQCNCPDSRTHDRCKHVLAVGLVVLIQGGRYAHLTYDSRPDVPSNRRLYTNGATTPSSHNVPSNQRSRF
jgi:hypothetical protein